MPNLLKEKTYKVIKNGKQLKMTIPGSIGLKPGERFYIRKTSSGIIELIPVKINKK